MGFCPEFWVFSLRVVSEFNSASDSGSEMENELEGDFGSKFGIDLSFGEEILSF